MTNMFARCTSLKSLDVSSFNTANVSDMSYMFEACRALSVIYVGDGEYRVIALSMSNSALPTANGHLLQLRLSLPAGEGSIALSRLLLVTPGAQPVTAISETRATDGGATTADGTYYDLSGRLMKLSNSRLPKGVYIVNHKKVVIK